MTDDTPLPAAMELDLLTYLKLFLFLLKMYPEALTSLAAHVPNVPWDAGLPITLHSPSPSHLLTQTTASKTGHAINWESYFHRGAKSSGCALCDP